MIINSNNFLIWDDGLTNTSGQSDLPEGYIWHDSQCAYLPLLVYGEAMRFYINITKGLNYLIPNPSIVSLKLRNSRTSQTYNFVATLQEDIFTNDNGEDDYTFYAEVVIPNTIPNGEYYFIIGNNTLDYLTSNLVRVITSNTNYLKNTARVTFSHDRYFYGFNYQNVTTFTQQFRLTLNEIDMQPESDREVYNEVTTGKQRVYNEFKKRVRKVEGYYFDKYAHEAADVLFGHSYILINGRQYQPKGVWQINRDVTQKKYKGSVDVYDLGFSEVARCLDIIGSSGGSGSGSGGDSCVAVNMGAVNLPNGVIGQPYQYSFTVNGDLPIIMTINSQPSWVDTIVINGHVVTIEGTPIANGNETVDLTFTNCSGDSIPFVDTIFVPVQTTCCIIPSTYDEHVGAYIRVKCTAQFAVTSAISVLITVHTNHGDESVTVNIALGNTIGVTRLTYGFGDQVTSTIEIVSITPSSDATYEYLDCS